MNEMGVFLIDKPEGITSFDVIGILRKKTQIKKIGHTGTLDPFATGLLAVCVGKATRIADMISTKNKTYQAKIILGAKTDTGDHTGKIIKKTIIYENISSNLDKIIPEILAIKEQIPPKFSAKKVDGKRAYKLARNNVEFDLKPNPIQIEKFQIIDIDLPFLTYEATVSKGTYIRVLSETLAEKLGTVATTTELRRIKIGNLFVENSVKLEKITPQNWRKFLIPLENIFTDFPKIKLAANEVLNFGNGRELMVEEEDQEKIMVVGEDKKCMGFARIEHNKLKPKLVLI
ncbi:MAG: tRNA pseudouridine(55) synthase TruB [Candidatus Cloacimonetes bacterium]|nr:tRNA pseudouridine(55) synthase TruB [Candidatus Cloacimonadota bacterium]